MDNRGIFLIIETVFSLLIAFVVLFKAKNKRINQLFFAFVMSCTIWLVSEYLANIPSVTALVWNKLTFVGAELIGLFLLLFSMYFPNEIKFKNDKLIKQILIVFSILFVVLIQFTPLLIESIFEIPDGIDIKFGVIYYPFAIVFLLELITSIIIFFISLKKSKGRQKTQIEILFIGIIISTIIISFTNLILPAFFNIITLSNYGTYFLVILIFCIAYSILAHHLFDIRVVVKKTFIYSALLSFVFGTYVLIVFSFTKFFGNTYLQTVIPGMVAAVFIAIGFDPIKRVITRFTEKYFFKGEYSPQDVLNKLTQTLSSVLDLDEALESIINTLVTEMKLERAATVVITREPEKKQLFVKRIEEVGYDKDVELKVKNGLLTFFTEYIEIEKNKPGRELFIEEKEPQFQKTKLVKAVEKIAIRPFVTDEMEREDELGREDGKVRRDAVRELRKLKTAVVIPIIVKGNLIGIFMLGDKKSGDIFNSTDLNLLTIIANQTASAIEKARFYEEDQLKSEFVSIASHELLTPTSAIEGYLSMILDEGMGHVDKKAKGYLEKVYASSQRLARLVKDLLNVSRIEGGRIVIQSKDFDVRELVKTVSEEMLPKVKEKKLELVVEGIDRDVPEVWADPERVHQVLVNLVSNAVKYTDKGTITVRVDFSLSIVRVSVSDTGIGIASDEIPHLFEKFYRASNADSGGAQGTGLGLYITKSIVEKMGGMISLDSEIDKGTTVSFSLPRGKEVKN